MSRSSASSVPAPVATLWEKLRTKGIPISFEIELTARCNNNCRHCYINLPAGDRRALESELTFRELDRLATEAVSMGACACLVTGGEPLLREDFSEIFTMLKQKGLLVSVFTNATLIDESHVDLFRRYPPRDLEVTVYGATERTYEKVTRSPGSYKAFKKGIGLLHEARIQTRFKAMLLRSNAHEFTRIARFCNGFSPQDYRFDPFLHLRYDRDAKRNREIKAERLSAGEIVTLEKKDPRRFRLLKKNVGRLIRTTSPGSIQRTLFPCGIGQSSFVMGADGWIRPCAALHHPDFMYDWRRGNLPDAWNRFIPETINRERDLRSSVDTCITCPLINLCLWCPALTHLETGCLDRKVAYFCRVAKARANLILKPTDNLGEEGKLQTD